MARTLYIVIADDGLNGPYIEMVASAPVNMREFNRIREEEQRAGLSSRPHNGFQLWKIDSEELNFEEVR